MNHMVIFYLISNCDSCPMKTLNLKEWFFYPYESQCLISFKISKNDWILYIRKLYMCGGKN